MTLVQKLIVGIVVMLLVFGSGYWIGTLHEETSVARSDAKQETKAVAAETKIEQKNEKDAAPVVQAIAKEQVRTQILIKEVPRVQIIHDQVMGPALPVGGCPAAVTHADGVLINAAASGDDSTATGPIPDGPAVPAQDLTASVIDNYGSCNKYIQELAGLQRYVSNTIINQKLLCPR